MAEEENVTISISVPGEMIPLIDARVREKDTDRSKYIRELVRRDFEQAGVKMQRRKAA